MWVPCCSSQSARVASGVALVGVLCHKPLGCGNIWINVGEIGAFNCADLVYTYLSTVAAQCVAFDAAEERVAAGDVSGRISIWNAYPAAVASSAATSAPPAEAQHAEQPGGGGGAPHQQQQQQPGKGGGGRDAGLTKQTLHWHSGPVRALSFGREGAYLLSGGDEAVLVRPCWRGMLLLGSSRSLATCQSG